MRKLILKMSMTADGFVGGPNGEVDWIFSNRDPDARQWTVEAISQAGLHIMGSRTFADMIAWWPYSSDVFAAPMNDIPKAVFTTKGREGVEKAKKTQAITDAGAANPGGKREPDPKVLQGWKDAYVAAGPLADEIARLKQQPGRPIVAHGGAGFARSLIAAGLIDEYRLLVHPHVLGKGLPIFSDLPKPMPLKLVSATAFPGGAVAKIYRPG